jgi:hypothetical protein
MIRLCAPIPNYFFPWSGRRKTLTQERHLSNPMVQSLIAQSQSCLEASQLKGAQDFHLLRLEVFC